MSNCRGPTRTDRLLVLALVVGSTAAAVGLALLTVRHLGPSGVVVLVVGVWGMWRWVR